MTNIQDDSLRKVSSTGSIYQAAVEEGSKASPKTDSGASSIEKSKYVQAYVVPSLNSPILDPAKDWQAFAIALIDATSGLSSEEYIYTVSLRIEVIENKVLNGWKENLRQIEEEVRKLLASPLYQQLQDIRRLGDPQSNTVSGVQGVTSANAAAQAEKIGFLSTLDYYIRVVDRVPPTAEIPDSAAPRDASRALVLPLMAVMLVGGGLALGIQTPNSANPVSGIVEIAQRLQPLFPTLSVQDIVPVINLMVVGPLYFNSWNEAVGNLKGRDRRTHVSAIQNFAKDVLKIVADPDFVKKILIERMAGTENLSPADQERLTLMLKVVLIGVSLSLLYSAEVGKVQDGKFGGIEPQEFRDLLLGKFADLPNPDHIKNPQEQLKASLISGAWNQLNQLSPEDRVKSLDMFLSYFTNPRDLDPMLDPLKVFDETLSASSFTLKDKTDMVKG